MLTSTYVMAGAYNPPVKDFGVKLGALIDRLDLEHVEIARIGLGDRASKKTRQAFANYISRMRAGSVPNPGLLQIERLATGMGLTLSTFFTEIETSDKHRLESPDQTRHTRPDSVGNQFSGGPHGGDSVVSSAPLADPQLFEQAGRFLLSLAMAAKTEQARQTRPPRTPSSRRRKHGGTRD